MLLGLDLKHAEKDLSLGNKTRWIGNLFLLIQSPNMKEKLVPRPDQGTPKSCLIVAPISANVLRIPKEFPDKI